MKGWKIEREEFPKIKSPLKVVKAGMSGENKEANKGKHQ